MTDKDAFNYIETVCKDNLKKYDIKEVKQMIQDATGGRISLLKMMANEINHERSLEGKCQKYIFQLFDSYSLNINIEYRQRILRHTDTAIFYGGMETSTTKVYEPFWKVAKLLFASEDENKVVESEKVIRLLNDMKMFSRLRKSNLFFYNAKDEISFQFRATQQVLSKKVNEENE